MQTKELTGPSRVSVNISWRLHSHKGCLHHTMHQFQRRICCHQKTPLRPTCWVGVLVDDRNSAVISIRKWVLWKWIMSQVVFFEWDRPYLDIFLPSPSWIDEYMNTRLLFYIKFLIGCICKLHVYILVAKELGEMSSVFFLKR